MMKREKSTASEALLYRRLPSSLSELAAVRRRRSVTIDVAAVQHQQPINLYRFTMAQATYVSQGVLKAKGGGIRCSMLEIY